MKLAVALLAALLSVGTASPGVAGGLPEAVSKIIQKYSALPPAHPPRTILRTAYKDKPAYFVTAACCDIPSELYDENGALLCYPSGGFAGTSDACPGFSLGASPATVVWRDSRPALPVQARP